jgi:hypothetical protein
MNSLLQSCRDNLGAAPRSFPRSDRKYLYPALPRWMAQDKLLPLQKHRHTLLKRGRVVWSSLVQANKYLYQPDSRDAPALVVWSEEPTLANDPLALRCLAHEIFDLKGTTGTGELADLGALVQAEMERPLNYAVPASLAENAFMTTILVFRRHLPCGFLTSGLLPLLILPEETPFSMILPGRFWPDELKDR